MAHGGYGRRRVDERRPPGRPSSAATAAASKGLGVDSRRKKTKPVTLKNQIRSTERMLQKDLPKEVRQAQEKKLEDLKRKQDLQTRLASEKKNVAKYKMIKFFERQKITRQIRQLEKKQLASSDPIPDVKIADELFQLRQDLEYIKFFPRNEKYVSVVKGDPSTVAKRNKLRDQIKANIATAAASGKDLEETASDGDTADVGDNDFFTNGSSSDEAEEDDEHINKNVREQASSALGKATLGKFSNEKNQRQRYAQVLMPPPRSLPPDRNQSQEKVERLASSNTSKRVNGPFNKKLSYQSTQKDHRGNLSSTSDVHKPRRKRRPKKKKQV